jgi:hypothetical protein
VTPYVPDIHHFRGSFGGKDAIPLWRNADATDPNVTDGLLDLLGSTYGAPVSPEDLLAYTYALLAGPGYAALFREELTTPGPRIPLTRDAGLFAEAVAHGRRLIWLHTYGERFVPEGVVPCEVPQGAARVTADFHATPDTYPESFEYDAATRTLHVGAAAMAPVTPEVWAFSVSGLQVVRSWLAYRMKKGAGKTSSDLDRIRPLQWTLEMTHDLIQLIWMLEETVALAPALHDLLDRIVAGPVFRADELPAPTALQRRAPHGEDEEQTGLAL